MTLTRREAIRLGLMGSSSLLLPWGFASPALAQFSPFIERFKQPFRVPQVLEPVRRDETTDYYQITLQKAEIEILPGKMTEIWSYKGSNTEPHFVGPTIRQRGGLGKEGGRQSVVRFINRLGKETSGLDIKTTTHLHGMASLPQYDGYAEDYIYPEYFKDYIYLNDRAATLWYHDHTLDRTARNVYMGLAGMYIVEDQYELNLPLPKGDLDAL
jgi:FtsP/CotA-like multicopper oxidase with cupredoxin domain